MKNGVQVFCILAAQILACSQPASTPSQPAANTSVSNQVRASDMEDRRKWASTLKGYADKGDFSQLEKVVQTITATKERFPGGDWKLERFYEAIANPPDGPGPTEFDREEGLKEMQKWAEAYPQSIFANIGLAKAQIGMAWKLRGRSFAGDVSTEGWKEFEQYLRLAESTLEKSSSKRKDCLAWHTAMQTIGKGLGWKHEKMLGILQEASTLESLYYPVYDAHATYLLPRWHGQPGEWEEFANEQSEKIGATEGSILYSEICWQMSRYYPGNAFFQQNKVSWPKIRAGFLEREKQYGLSLRYLNAFCMLAGSAADVRTTRRLFQKIGDQWEPDFWVEKKYFDGYKQWAFSH